MEEALKKDETKCGQEWKQIKSLVDFTLTMKVSFSSQTAQSTKDLSKMGILKELESLYILMGRAMRVIGRLEILTDSGYSHSQMEVNTKGPGTRVNIMEKAYIRHHLGPNTTEIGRWVDITVSGPLHGQMVVSIRVNGGTAERTGEENSLE